MAVKVLGISSSPRLKSNSDLLLREALAGAESVGAQVEYVRLSDLNIAPCTECNACYKTGRCIIEDDYQILSAKMLDADRLIFATPIFFMTVCAQAKILIDRFQCLWAHKSVLNKPLITGSSHDRRAMVIAVGGSKSKKMFESVQLTMKYFLDVLDFKYAANLFVNKINDCSEIEKHTPAMKEAHRLGSELITINALPSKTPNSVEIT